MQNRSHKIIAVLFLIGMVVLAVYGSTKEIQQQGHEQSVNETSKHKVAIITKSTQSAFWKSVYAGANAASTEYNLTITFQGPENEEDYETQNYMIREAVKNNVEAIVFSAVDFHANASAIDEAAKAGVKIVSIDSDVNSSQVSCHISTDNYMAGKMAGQAALDLSGETMNIGIVNFDKNSANGQQREQGFRDIVEMDLRANIVSAINVLSTTEDAKAGTVDMLKAHPEINVIATFNEWTSLGVGYAVQELQLAADTTVIAFDSNVVSVGMLETGEVDGLIVQNPYAMGYLGVESAYNLLNNLALGDTEVDTATTLVTRHNMYDDECQRIMFAFD